MGKKQQGKVEAPNPHTVVNREVFQRLNFLYQASVYLKELEVTTPGPSTSVSKTQQATAHKKGRKRQKISLGDLGSTYVRNMRTIGNKTVVRMDPNVKRTLCKGCDTVLLPGATASVRVKGSPAIGHMVAYTCLECKASRKIPAPPVASASTRHVEPSPTATVSILREHVLESVPELSEPTNPHWQRKKRNLRVPRSLPLFAREDAGHVVFRGNEVLRNRQD